MGQKPTTKRSNSATIVPKAAAQGGHIQMSVAVWTDGGQQIVDCKARSIVPMDGGLPVGHDGKRRKRRTPCSQYLRQHLSLLNDFGRCVDRPNNPHTRVENVRIEDRRQSAQQGEGVGHSSHPLQGPVGSELRRYLQSQCFLRNNLY